MPPRKKSAAKTFKQELLEETLPELPASRKIPKRPFFRYVDYDSSAKVKHIRVKLWKMHSCSMLKLDEKVRYDHSENGLPALKNSFKSSTIKKSLKNVKRFKYNTFYFFRYRLPKNIGSTWRLDSLFLFFAKQYKNYEVFKPFINPSLKNCLISTNIRWDRVSPKLVARLRTVKKCKLIIASECGGFSISINLAKLPPCEKFKNFFRSADDQYYFHSNWFVKNVPECFEEIRFLDLNPYSEWLSIYPDHSSIQNLQELRLTLRESRETMNISFVKQYPRLQILELFLIGHEPDNPDFLADLPCLKSLLILSYESHLREKQPIKQLPNLTQLEELKLHSISSSIFTVEHVGELISKNKGLKKLDLSLTIQEIGILFEDFALPNIEKLRLKFDDIEAPYAGGAKKIVEVLKAHDSIKQVILELSHSYGDLITTLLKDGVAKMKSLEKLKLRFVRPGGLDENKFKHLKDVLVKNPSISEVDLDLRSETIGTRELGMILDSLVKLKNLKKFIFQARLTKMTPAAFNKLCDTILSLGHLKKLELNLFGVSKEDGEILRETVLPKCPLAEDSFSFTADAMGAYNIYAREYD